MDFRESLGQRVLGKLSPEEANALPRGFQTLQDVAILNLKPVLWEKRGLIAAALLDIYPYIKSVWGKVFGESKVTGQFRTPTGLEHIAGTRKSEVLAKENGVIFKHDFTQVIFSKGNITERSYLPKLVRPGEHVLDMFAGIGYFSLMIAKHASPAHVDACEINPASYKYLVDNIKLNGLEHVVTPHLGDCAKIVPDLVKAGLKADRIVMGVFPPPKEYLPVAFQAVRHDTGTVIHYEGKVSDGDTTTLLEDVKEEAGKTGLVKEVTLLGSRLVKSLGIRKQHGVIDVMVK
nr:methyltransferase [Candidatus Sigynarchaeum springense]